MPSLIIPFKQHKYFGFGNDYGWARNNWSDSYDRLDQSHLLWNAGR